MGLSEGVRFVARCTRAASCGLLVLLAIGSGCKSADHDLFERLRNRDRSGSADDDGNDAGADGAPDAGLDAGPMTEHDAFVPNTDGGDTGAQGSDGGMDSGMDSGTDSGVDTDAAEPDADADVDGGPSCGVSGKPCCENDAGKTDPGVCGCDVPDTDTDNDSTPDCNDACPDDPDKTDPGTCGCGFIDQDTATLASCVGLRAALVHRYRFEGSGGTALDDVGSQDGTVMGTQLDGSGRVVLSGTGQYVDLPNKLISTLNSATLEVWVQWDGGSTPWERIFDFGDPTSGGEGAQGTGRSYLFLTPLSDGTSSTLRLAYKRVGNAEVVVNDSAQLDSTAPHHLAAVVDGDASRISLYLDGAYVDGADLPYPLSDINDINSWLGRSQFSVDPDFAGSIDEFRIYDAALSDIQVAASFAAGPDAPFLSP